MTDLGRFTTMAHGPRELIPGPPGPVGPPGPPGLPALRVSWQGSQPAQVKIEPTPWQSTSHLTKPIPNRALVIARYLGVNQVHKTMKHFFSELPASPGLLWVWMSMDEPSRWRWTPYTGIPVYLTWPKWEPSQKAAEEQKVARPRATRTLQLLRGFAPGFASQRERYIRSKPTNSLRPKLFNGS